MVRKILVYPIAIDCISDFIRILMRQIARIQAPTVGRLSKELMDKTGRMVYLENLERMVVHHISTQPMQILLMVNLDLARQMLVVSYTWVLVRIISSQTQQITVLIRGLKSRAIKARLDRQGVMEKALKAIRLLIKQE